MSYIGILIVAPIITSFLYGDKTPGYLASSIIQSASAQILCLPVLVYSYGEFSILGILANLLISPTISVVMVASMIAGVLSLVGLESKIINVPLSFLLQSHISIIEQLSKVSWGSIALEKENPLILLVYVAVFVIVIILKKSSGYSFHPRTRLEKAEKNGKIYTC